MTFLNNNKILIVGGAGFVGSNLAYHLLKYNNPKKIILIDNFLSSEKDNIPLNKKIKLISGSIIDDKILKKNTFRY